ncbi:hypothetical protein [Psychrobacillus phage Perkons]|nr:hypothetical protein [Psychrobacillus phage Perkons]
MMAELEKMNYQVIARTSFDTLSPWKNMRRCTVLDNGTVNYYLDSNDSTKKEDGSPANLTGVDGQVMVEIPKFWWKAELGTVESKRTFRWFISDVAKEGFAVHPAFFRDRDGTGVAKEVDFRYFSVYMGYKNGTKLESRSGITATATQTIGAFRTQAQARGNGWGLIDYNLVFAVQLLYLLEYGHFDSQTKIGRGYVDGNTGYTNTGSTNRYGNKSFGETTGKQQMSYRGIEDFYGNYYYWVDGIVSNAQFNVLVGNKGFNDAGTGYDLHVTENTANTSGYIGDMQDNESLGFLIKNTTGGSETSKLYDYGVLAASRVAGFGGFRSSGSYAGAFLLQLADATSSSSAGISSRLAF